MSDEQSTVCIERRIGVTPLSLDASGLFRLVRRTTGRGIAVVLKLTGSSPDVDLAELGGPHDAGRYRSLWGRWAGREFVLVLVATFPNSPFRVDPERNVT